MYGYVHCSESSIAWLSLQELVEVAESMPYIAAKKDRKMGRQKVATNILVAGSLRHLGKGFDFTGSVCRETYVGKSLMLAFHHEFMKELGAESSKFYQQYVKWPEEGCEEFAANLAAFDLLGFPGCAASIDGTHIPWERAPECARSW
jgi:hypothetical protein